jgi:hypothetical protein
MPLPGLPSFDVSAHETTRRRDNEEDLAAHRGLIKQWTRDALNLTDEATVTLTALRCSQSSCDPQEVVIAVFNAGQPSRSVQIYRALMDVDQHAVCEAWRKNQDSAVST